MLFRRATDTAALPEITSTEQCDALLAQDLAVLFKHSSTCPVSWAAHREVMRFQHSQPNTPIYLIPVRQRRDVARHIAESTGVRHESPQVLVMRQGEVIAAASHFEVTADLLSAVVPK